MTTIHEELTQAVQLHSNGRIAEAKTIYQRVLSDAADNANALHLLGVVELQEGNPERAIELITHAVELCANDVNFYGNLATAYQTANQHRQAIETLERVLAIEPRSESAFCGIARSLRALGMVDESIAKFHRVLVLNANHLEANIELAQIYVAKQEITTATRHYAKVTELAPQRLETFIELGNMYRTTREFDKARHQYQIALDRDAKQFAALNGMGVVFSQLGEIEDAIKYFEKANLLDDLSGEAYSNLGKVLIDEGRFQEAEVACRQAIAFNPRAPIFHNNLGIALMAQQQNEEAAACFRKAIELDQNYAIAWSNRGIISQRQREPEKALSHYEQANRLDPSNVSTLQNLAVLHHELKQPESSLSSFRMARSLKPSNAGILLRQMHTQLELGDWKDLPALWEQFLKMDHSTTASLTPLTLMAFPAKPELLLQCAKKWSATIRPPELEPTDSSIPKQIDFETTCNGPTVNETQNDKIRVAYLSADFRQHPVAQLAVELIELHNRKRFQVVGYAIGGNDESKLGTRIRSAFDQLTDLDGMTDRKVVDKIRADRIDVLIDLVGYTKGTRENVLAARPAAVQINFLGYPGTMGANWLDYIVADAFVLPAESQHNYSESPILMPDCFQINTSLEVDSLPVPTRIESGLPENAVVLCCFNMSHKINPQVWAVWMRILKSVPETILWIKSSQVRFIQNMKSEAERAGVDPERIVIASQTKSVAEHYRRVRNADLFLDTWPYNAHATASDMLRNGVPVLTLAGETFASRVAGSLLNSLGLNDLITSSTDEYVLRATELAQSQDKLKEVRRRLTGALSNSALYDARRFTRNFESALEEILRRHQQAESPKVLTVQ